MGFAVMVGSVVHAQHQDWDTKPERHTQVNERNGRDSGDEKYDRYSRRDRDDDRDFKRNQYPQSNKNSAWFNADYRWGGYKRYVTYHHHRHHRPDWSPRYGDRYNSRYIFYEDYNLYYDCHRDVFVLWTGHVWVTTSRVPKVMYRIDFNRTRIRGVDYWDDDLDRYLNRKRPVYVTLDRW